jgi:hypothetical protein
MWLSDPVLATRARGKEPSKERKSGDLRGPLESWVTTPGPSPLGSFSKFVNVMSARTAVGHDREGQLILFHADGQTEQRG